MQYQLTDKGILVRDNVIAILEDPETGDRSVITTHNTPTTWALNALAQWLAGFTNQTYGSVPWPTYMQLGNGSGSTFTPVSGTTKPISSISYLGNGQTEAVCQWTSADPTGTFTQVAWQDASGNIWFMADLTNPVTKTGTQNLTIQWTNTFQA